MNGSVPAESLITDILNELGECFPDETMENVRELVEYGEPGMALEVLCTQLVEYAIELSNENRSKLKRAACLMNIPLSELDGLTD